MSSILSSFRKAKKCKEERGWDRIYVAIDVHDTIWPGSYKEGQGQVGEFYRKAKECLQFMSNQSDIILIGYTCSLPADIQKIKEKLANVSITFDYFNSNPEAKTTELACFDDKPYFNVLLDDKAGFTPSDWDVICTWLRTTWSEV